MSDTWKITGAKIRMHQLVDKAIQEGPQIVTRHGVPVAVILSMEKYLLLTGTQEKITDFFRHSPLAGVDIDLSRVQ